MPEKLIKPTGNYRKLLSYQKTEVIYEMTYYFCQHYLQKGDRTIDQMVQAARSGKQNIVEGSEDGKTSTAMEVNLLNVARSSIGELRQDFEDFLKSRHLPIWTPADERFQPMQDFTKQHNLLSDYEPYFQQWTAEEMANVGLTLCYQVDVMMNKYLKGIEEIFIKEGGVKERMHKARTDYRRQQDDRLAELERTLPQLQQQLTVAQEEAAHWKAAYEDLKQRALKAYYQQQDEIKELKKRLESL
jgi:four helix bundle suffix protein